MTADDIKAKIIRYLQDNPQIDFVTMSTEIPEIFGGPINLGNQELNVLMWPGLSDIGDEALRSLGRDGIIAFQAVPLWYYVLREVVPDLPVTTEEGVPDAGYPEPHWLPGVMARGENFPWSKARTSRDPSLN